MRPTPVALRCLLSRHSAATYRANSTVTRPSTHQRTSPADALMATVRPPPTNAEGYPDEDYMAILNQLDGRELRYGGVKIELEVEAHADSAGMRGEEGRGVKERELQGRDTK